MPAVSVHPASDEERLAAYRNVHETWGRGLPLDEFLARRLKSVGHNRARWWVATVDGNVASSLGCHPLLFNWHGRVVPGFGICAVHTLPSFRRHGLADQLCRAAIADAAARGDKFGLLFSDIAPGYYARMGFCELPALSYRCEHLPELAEFGPALSCTAIDPQAEITWLMDCYEAAHRADELFLARDRAYWEYALARQPAARYYRLESASGNAVGYVRLGPVTEGVCSLELALVGDAADHQQAAYGAATRAAISQGAAAIHGWLREDPFVKSKFTAHRREREIPMVLPLSSELAWPASQPPRHHFWHTDHF